MTNKLNSTNVDKAMQYLQKELTTSDIDFLTTESLEYAVDTGAGVVTFNLNWNLFKSSEVLGDFVAVVDNGVDIMDSQLTLALPSSMFTYKISDLIQSPEEGVDYAHLTVKAKEATLDFLNQFGISEEIVNQYAVENVFALIEFLEYQSGLEIINLEGDQAEIALANKQGLYNTLVNFGISADDITVS